MFSKAKAWLLRQMACVCVFTNLLNVWVKRGHLGSYICSAFIMEHIMEKRNKTLQTCEMMKVMTAVTVLVLLGK